MDQREMRALHIAATTKLVANGGCWRVPSQTGTGNYRVSLIAEGDWRCTCPDFEERRMACKHVMAVTITVNRDAGTKTIDYSELVKVTYRQDWTAYNAAQTDEKRMFVALLAELCSGIPQPPHIVGRPKLPYSDMAFATVFKTYSRFSSRRFASDLRAAADEGLIDKVPAFNSVLRYGRDPALTPILSGLVQVSAMPMGVCESQFAIDSTGFGAPNKRSWYSTKHGRIMEQQNWRKLHAVIGTHTHIVTACEVTEANAADAPMLPTLAERTADEFDMRELSADKGYSSKANADVIEQLGATPFIAFKGNTVEPPPGSAWARMYHYFQDRQDEYLDKYHRRSNVETAFSMMKRKFGERLRGKTTEAQDNEVLSIVVAHNLCVLIQSFYELGITPTFLPLSRPEAPDNVISLAQRARRV